MQVTKVLRKSFKIWIKEFQLRKNWNEKVEFHLELQQEKKIYNIFTKWIKYTQSQRIKHIKEVRAEQRYKDHLSEMVRKVIEKSDKISKNFHKN